MRSRVFITALALAGGCLWAAPRADAAEISGSISIGKTTTKSETTVTIYPSGETYTSTTRTETRGGGYDVSVGQGRWRGHHGPHHGRWEPRGYPYGTVYYGPYGPVYSGPVPYGPRLPNISVLGPALGGYPQPVPGLRTGYPQAGSPGGALSPVPLLRVPYAPVVQPAPSSTAAD